MNGSFLNLSRRLNEKHPLRHINRIADLANKLKINNEVLVTFGDYSYMEAFYVSYITSRLWRYPNFFVVAVDKRMYDILESQGIPVALLRVSYPVGKDLLVKVNKLTYNKFVIIRRILLLGINCLYIDSDVILFKDPFSELSKPKYADADILAQQDIHLCTGFIYFRPTNSSFDVIERSLQLMKVEPLNGQEAMVRVVTQRYVPSLKYILLDLHLFSRGGNFFEEHQFCWTPIGNTSGIP